MGGHQAGADTYALIGGLSTLTGGAAAALGALSNATAIWELPRNT